MRFISTFDKPINNNALIVFRIFFGFLMFCESIGAILTGWVKETFVEPTFTFNFIHLDVLQLLVGPQMYAVYSLMAICSLMIMLGYRYRIATIGFWFLWMCTYLGQKSHYNNHYYLIWLIAFFMILVPANRAYSLDVKEGRVTHANSCPQWCIWLFTFQVAIVYFYASVAKLYPDWLAAKPVEIWFSNKTFESSLWSAQFAEWLRSIFHQKATYYLFSYAGIFFDLLVVPMFLINRWTRLVALILSLLFHLTNSAIFQIGVFPYFALAFVIFFYSPEFIGRIFLSKKETIASMNSWGKPSSFYFKLFFLAYFAIQIALPLRHHIIPEKVLWTEEGHRLSWRMMLRTKQGITKFYIQEKGSQERERINILDYVSINQYGDVIAKPDMMWQLAQYIKKQYKKDGKEVAVFVNSQVSVNGRPYSTLTNDSIDIAATPWKMFGHQEWLLPAPF